jgi:Tfp pilus assembly PilM family ATPase
MNAWLREWTRRFGRRPKTLAIDFDSAHLRVVQFDASRWGSRVVGLRSLALPADVDVANADSVGTLLKNLVEEMGLAGADMIMNVPRSQAVLKVLTLPAGTPQTDLAGMVQYQIANELPFDAAEAVVDFTVTTHGGAEAPAEGVEQGLSVLAAAVRLPVVDYYRRLAEVAGLHPARLCLRPASNLRCLDACVKRRGNECLALVDVTADETEIDFIMGPSLLFSRSAPLADAAAPGDGAQVVQSVVTEMLRSLQSFQAGHRGGKLDVVLVSGQSELARDVVAALSGRAGAKCELFDPAKGLDLPAGAPAAAFSAALGAAMTAADTEGFDFLHPRRPEVRTDRRKTRVALAGVAAGFLLLLCMLGGSSMVKSRADEASRMAADAEREKTLWEKTVNPMGGRVDRLETWQNSQVDWLGHLGQLSALLPGAADIYVSRLDTSSTGEMNLAIHARQRECIDQLETKLATSGYRIHPSNVAARSDPKGLGYVFESTVQTALDPKALQQEAPPVPPRPADDSYRDPAGASPAPTPAPAASPAPTPSPTPAAMPPAPSRASPPHMSASPPNPQAMPTPSAAQTRPAGMDPSHRQRPVRRTIR